MAQVGMISWNHLSFYGNIILKRVNCISILFTKRSIFDSTNNNQEQQIKHLSTNGELLNWSLNESAYLCTTYLSNILKSSSAHPKALECCQYIFNGSGKLIRPRLVLLTSLSCLPNKNNGVKNEQKTIAMITEIIHTASLIHDDIIDDSTLRRNRPSCHAVYGELLTTFIADFMISISSQLLARLGNVDVVKLLSQAMEDIVCGEIGQRQTSNKLEDQIQLYLKKTHAKTASLMENACAAVAVFSDENPKKEVINAALNVGKHVGMAYQLVDDMLDMIGDQNKLGKPAVSDMKLGLGTGPVLFAAKDCPDLCAIINRKFRGNNDIQLVKDLVMKYDGIGKTKLLAKQHTKLACENAKQLPNIYRNSLIQFIKQLLNRYF